MGQEGHAPDCAAHDTADGLVPPGTFRRRVSASQPPSPFTDPGCRHVSFTPDTAAAPTQRRLQQHPRVPGFREGDARPRQGQTPAGSAAPAPHPWSLPPSNPGPRYCWAGACSPRPSLRPSAEARRAREESSARRTLTLTVGLGRSWGNKCTHASLPDEPFVYSLFRGPRLRGM